MTYPLAFFSVEGIDPILHKQAKAAARRGNVEGILCCADSNESLYLFSKNLEWFSLNGLYEKALLAAWVNQKVMPRNGNVLMKRALRSANRKKLMEHSDPLPEGDTFVVYRGAQKGKARGVSWTLDPNVARRFANLFGLGGGTVYKTVVQRSDIFAYVSDVTGRCGEKETLLVLPRSHPIEAIETIQKGQVRS